MGMIQRLTESHLQLQQQQQWLIAAWWAAIDALQRTWTNRTYHWSPARPTPNVT